MSKIVQKLQAITLSDMLAAMDSGIVFSVRFISFDKKRPLKNGRTIEYREARLEQAVRADADEREVISAANKDFIRKIRLYSAGRPTSETRSIHALLIEDFNGRELLL